MACAEGRPGSRQHGKGIIEGIEDTGDNRSDGLIEEISTQSPRRSWTPPGMQWAAGPFRALQVLALEGMQVGVR